MPIRTLIMLFIIVFIGTWIGISLIQVLEGLVIDFNPKVWSFTNFISNPVRDPYRLIASLVISVALLLPGISNSIDADLRLNSFGLGDIAFSFLMSILALGLVYLISIPALPFLQILYNHVISFPFHKWRLVVDSGLGFKKPDEVFFLQKLVHFATANQFADASPLWSLMTSHLFNHFAVCLTFLLSLRGLLNFRKLDDSERMMRIEKPVGNPKAWYEILRFYKILAIGNFIARNRLVFTVTLLLWLLPTVLTNTLPFTDPALLLDFSGRVISTIGMNYPDLFELPSYLDRTTDNYIHSAGHNIGLELYLHLLVTRGFILFTILLLLAFIRKKVAEFSVWTRR
jgi:hypothetical protein